ncbi:SNF2 family helicase [Spironucleus salmonicida]|uniref:SNF2 family chromodomain helicase-DNA-binding protein n=1 Tax=Spironucleus salmonicida TaxID=348837 RepID=V6M1F1_9EUKA|nr:SNF2 family helicase [Spironucleus salmonicida]|eukprot:EST47014.1 SNF2 family chromodomain helicase-DNA-binding protein [Spironucleus salmonicida]
MNVQQQIQEAIRRAEEQCLNAVQEEHKNAYLQLRQIIQQHGIDSLNQEQKSYYQQMDQYIEQQRKAAVDQIMVQNPQAQYQSSEQKIDFSSPEYGSQLRTYVMDIVQLPIHMLEQKFKALFISLIQKGYGRSAALQHLRNVLQQVDQYNPNPEKQANIARIWEGIQVMQEGGDEDDEGETINGVYIRPIPFTIPDEIITYMILPVRAQQLLNQRLRTGESVPHTIFIKRRKGRPSKDTGVAHEFYTPVFRIGQIETDVLQFFYSDSPQLASDVEQLAKKIYEQRDFYLRPENRNQVSQPTSAPTYNSMPAYGTTTYQAPATTDPYGLQGQYNFGGGATTSQYGTSASGVYGAAAPGFNQYNPYGATAASGLGQEGSEYDDASHIPTESDEFVEEQVSDDTSEQPMMPSDSGDDDHESFGVKSEPSVQDSDYLPSPENIEEEEEADEIYIEKVIECKEIPISEAWKYPPSIMVVPRPPNYTKFDSYKPSGALPVPRSDAGSILDRLGQIEEDVNGEQVQIMTQNTQNTQSVFIYLIKWRDNAYYHSTWEVEDFLTHLTSFIKVQNFKTEYKERKIVLQSDKLSSDEKQVIIDQGEERKHNYKLYCEPEKIVAYDVKEDQKASLEERLSKIRQIIREKGMKSDAICGAFSSSIDKIFYNNQNSKPEIDDKGFVVNQESSGVVSFKGYFYLIKWKNLSYSQSTWEIHEDLANMFGEDKVKALIRAYTKRSQPIKKMLSTNYLKFNERPIFKEFTSAHPDFLLDVNKEFILKPHQIRGVNVLLYNYCQHKNIILADQLGLGKTVQAVVFLSALYHQFLVPGPFLIVAPLTTIQAWIQTINDWFPDCNLVNLIGSKKDRQIIIDNELVQIVNGNVTNKFHIILTTPSIALIEELELKKFKYRGFLIDEAHSIKNERSKRNKIFTSFTTDCKLLITGTPIQNSISEFYNLLHFIDAEVFKNQQEFEKYGSLDDFRDGLNKVVIKNENSEQELINSTKMKEVDKIDKQNIFAQSDSEDLDLPLNMKPSDIKNTFVANTIQPDIIDKIEFIAQLLKPYILRRVAAVVEKSLPEKKEYILRMPLTEEQKLYSKSIVENNVNQLTSNEVVKLTNVMMQLKKVANHPYVVRHADINTLDLNTLVSQSSKFQVLEKLLPKLKQEGHRVLIFTQLTKTIKLLQRYCTLKTYKYQTIIGSTILDERVDAINQFNKSNSEDFIFLLTTKVSQGINLQTADTVIIFDVDFNPQNDLQAVGRAHRIGQMKPVTIYRFLTQDSVEEKIYEIAKRKMVLDYALVQSQSLAIESDSSILRKVLEYGIEQLDSATKTLSFDDIIDNQEEMKYGNQIPSPSNVKDLQFTDLQVENNQIFYNLIAQQDEPQFLNEPISSLTQNQASQLINAQIQFGLPKLANQIKEHFKLDFSPSQIHTLFNQLLTEAREHFRFSRLDIFNLPQEIPQISFSFQQVNCDAVQILNSFYSMLLIDLHIKNALFKLPRALYQEFEPAQVWNSQFDTILLLDCKIVGFNDFDSKKYSDLSDSEITVADLKDRVNFLIKQLQKLPSSKLYEQVHNDGLDTKLTFDSNINTETQAEQRENDIIKKLQYGEISRTTFNIPHQKHICTSSLQQVLKFFTVERKRKISSLVARFEEFSRAKFPFRDFIGITVFNGNQRLHKKFLNYLEKFPMSKSEEDLLFKLYHCIMDVVVTRIGDIINIVDEKIDEMKEKNQAINEIDNDSYVQKSISELLDYLYRNVWIHCEIRHIAAPYILAKMAEWYSESFDEELLEFGEDDGGNWFSTFRLDVENQNDMGDHGLDADDNDDVDYPY